MAIWPWATDEEQQQSNLGLLDFGSAYPLDTLGSLTGQSLQSPTFSPRWFYSPPEPIQPVEPPLPQQTLPSPLSFPWPTTPLALPSEAPVLSEQPPPQPEVTQPEELQATAETVPPRFFEVAPGVKVSQPIEVAGGLAPQVQTPTFFEPLQDISKTGQYQIGALEGQTAPEAQAGTGGILGAFGRGLTEKPEEAIPFVGQAKALYDTTQVLLAAKRLRQAAENDEPVDPNDVALLDKFQREQAQYDALKGWEKAAYQAGRIITAMPGFAGEFIATGGLYRVGATAGREAALAAARVAAKDAVEAYLAKKAGQEVALTAGERLAVGAIGAGTRLAGAVAGTAARLPVASGMRLIGGAAELASPDTAVAPDPEADKIRVIVQEASALPLHQAMLKSFGREYLELFTELLGGPTSEIVGAAAKRVLPAKLNEGLTLTFINRWLIRHPNSTLDDAIKFIREQASFHGPVSEWLEERYNDFLGATIGVSDWEQVKQGYTPQQIVSEAAAFTFYPLLGAGIRRAYYKARGIDDAETLRTLLGSDTPATVTPPLRRAVMMGLQAGFELRPEEVITVAGLESWLKSQSWAEFKDGVWRLRRDSEGQPVDLTPTPTNELARFLKLKEYLDSASLPEQARMKLQQAADAAYRNFLSGIRLGDVLTLSFPDENGNAQTEQLLVTERDGKRVAIRADGEAVITFDGPNENFLRYVSRGVDRPVQVFHYRPSQSPTEITLPDEEYQRAKSRVEAVRTLLEAGFTLRPDALDDVTVGLLLREYPDVGLDPNRGVLYIKPVPNAINAPRAEREYNPFTGRTEIKVTGPRPYTPEEIARTQDAVQAALRLIESGQSIDPAVLPERVAVYLSQLPNVTVEEETQDGVFKGYLLRLLRPGETKRVIAFDRVPYNADQESLFRLLSNELAGGTPVAIDQTENGPHSNHPAVLRNGGAVPINIARALAALPNVEYDPKTATLRTVSAATERPQPPPPSELYPLLKVVPNPANAILGEINVASVGPVINASMDAFKGTLTQPTAESLARIEAEVNAGKTFFAPLVNERGKPVSKEANDLLYLLRLKGVRYAPVQVVTAVVPVPAQHAAQRPSVGGAEERIAAIIKAEAGLPDTDAASAAFLITKVPELLPEERDILKEVLTKLQQSKTDSARIVSGIIAGKIGTEAKAEPNAPKLTFNWRGFYVANGQAASDTSDATSIEELVRRKLAEGIIVTEVEQWRQPEAPTAPEQPTPPPPPPAPAPAAAQARPPAAVTTAPTAPPTLISQILAGQRVVPQQAAATAPRQAQPAQAAPALTPYQAMLRSLPDRFAKGDDNAKRFALYSALAAAKSENPAFTFEDFARAVKGAFTVNGQLLPIWPEARNLIGPVWNSAAEALGHNRLSDLELAGALDTVDPNAANKAREKIAQDRRNIDAKIDALRGIENLAKAAIEGSATVKSAATLLADAYIKAGTSSFGQFIEKLKEDAPDIVFSLRHILESAWNAAAASNENATPVGSNEALAALRALNEDVGKILDDAPELLNSALSRYDAARADVQTIEERLKKAEGIPVQPGDILVLTTRDGVKNVLVLRIEGINFYVTDKLEPTEDEKGYYIAAINAVPVDVYELRRQLDAAKQNLAEAERRAVALENLLRIKEGRPANANSINDVRRPGAPVPDLSAPFEQAIANALASGAISSETANKLLDARFDMTPDEMRRRIKELSDAVEERAKVAEASSKPITALEALKRATSEVATVILRIGNGIVALGNTKTTRSSGQPNGVNADGHWAFVDLSDPQVREQIKKALLTGEAQLRTTGTGGQMMALILSNLDIYQLNDPTFPANIGPPTFDSEGAIAGRLRLRALIELYEAGGSRADLFRTRVVEFAKELGAGVAVEQMKYPVLVFYATDYYRLDKNGNGVKANRNEFAFEADKTAVRELTPFELSGVIIAAYGGRQQELDRLLGDIAFNENGLINKDGIEAARQLLYAAGVQMPMAGKNIDIFRLTNLIENLIIRYTVERTFSKEELGAAFTNMAYMISAYQFYGRNVYSSLLNALKANAKLVGTKIGTGRTLDISRAIVAILMQYAQDIVAGERRDIREWAKNIDRTLPLGAEYGWVSTLNPSERAVAFVLASIVTLIHENRRGAIGQFQDAMRQYVERALKATDEAQTQSMFGDLGVSPYEMLMSVLEAVSPDLAKEIKQIAEESRAANKQVEIPEKPAEAQTPITPPAAETPTIYPAETQAPQQLEERPTEAAQRRYEYNLETLDGQLKALIRLLSAINPFSGEELKPGTPLKRLASPIPDSPVAELIKAVGNIPAGDAFKVAWERILDQKTGKQIGVTSVEHGDGPLANFDVGEQPPMPDRGAAFANFRSLIDQLADLAPHVITVRVARGAKATVEDFWRTTDMTQLRRVAPKLAAFIAIRYQVSDWRSVTPEMVHQSVITMLKPTSAVLSIDAKKTINKGLGLLANAIRALNEVAADALVNKVGLGGVIKEERREPIKKVVAPVTIQRFLSVLRENAHKDPVAAFLYAVVAVASATGLRPAELLSLKMSSVLGGPVAVRDAGAAEAYDFGEWARFFGAPQRSGESHLVVGIRNGALNNVRRVKSRSGQKVYPAVPITPEAAYALENLIRVYRAIGVEPTYVFAPLVSDVAGDSRAVTEANRLVKEAFKVVANRYGVELVNINGAKVDLSAMRTSLAQISSELLDRPDALQLVDLLVLRHEPKGTTSAGGYYYSPVTGWQKLMDIWRELYSRLPWVKDWKPPTPASETELATLINHPDAQLFNPKVMNDQKKAYQERIDVFKSQVDAAFQRNEIAQDVRDLLFYMADNGFLNSFPRLELVFGGQLPEGYNAVTRSFGNMVRIVFAKKPNARLVLEEMLHVAYEVSPESIRENVKQVWRAELNEWRRQLESDTSEVGAAKRQVLDRILAEDKAGREISSAEYWDWWFGQENSRAMLTALSEIVYFYNPSEFFASLGQPVFERMLHARHSIYPGIRSEIQGKTKELGDSLLGYTKAATNIQNKGAVWTAIQRALEYLFAGDGSDAPIGPIAVERASLSGPESDNNDSPRPPPEHRTQILGELFTVLDKDQFQKEILVHKAITFLNSKGIPVSLGPDGRIYFDWQMHAALGTNLSQRFQQALTYIYAESTKNVELANAVRNIGLLAQRAAEIGTPFLDADIAAQLVSIGQSVASSAGYALSAFSHNEDIVSEIRWRGPIPWVRDQLSKMFGPTGAFESLLNIVHDLAKNVAQYFSPTEIGKLLSSDDPSVKELADRVKEILDKLERLKTVNRFFNIADRAIRPPVGNETSALAREALKEGLRSLVEFLKENGWQKPAQFPKLPAWQVLAALSEPKRIENISAAIQIAIILMERYAGREAWKAANGLSDTSPEVKAYDDKTKRIAAFFIDREKEERESGQPQLPINPDDIEDTFPDGPDPRPEHVRSGLEQPGFEGWKILVESYQHYSPITRGLARRLVREYFDRNKFPDRDLRKLAFAEPNVLAGAVAGFGDFIRAHIKNDNLRVRAAIEYVVFDELAKMLSEIYSRTIENFLTPKVSSLKTFEDSFRERIRAGALSLPKEFQEDVYREFQRLVKNSITPAEAEGLLDMTPEQKRAWIEAKANEIAQAQKLTAADLRDAEDANTAKELLMGALREYVLAAEERFVSAILREKSVEDTQRTLTPEQLLERQQKNLRRVAQLVKAESIWAREIAELRSKQTVLRVMPGLRELVELAFSTPKSKREAYAEAFARYLALTVGLDENAAEFEQAKKLFLEAFQQKMREAEAIAIQRSSEALKLPTRQKLPILAGKKGRRLWEKIQAAVNAGDFSTERILSLISSQKGVVVTQKDIQELERLANEEWQLRQLTPKQLEELEKKHGITARELALYLAGQNNLNDEQAAAYRKAVSDVMAATRIARREKQRALVAIWARMIYPISGADPLTALQNTMRALGEYSTAGALFTISFARWLALDVAFQSLLAGFYRPMSHATFRVIKRLRATLERSPNSRSDASELFKFVLTEYLDAFSRYFGALLRNLRATLSAGARVMLHRQGMPSRIETLESAVHFFDRLYLKIEDYRKRGGTVNHLKAMLLSALAMQELGMRFASATDAMLFAGFTEAEAEQNILSIVAGDPNVPLAVYNQFKDAFHKYAAQQITELSVLAPAILDQMGIPRTKANEREAIRAMRIARLLQFVNDPSVPEEVRRNMPPGIGEMINREVVRYISRLGWNLPENSVFGRIIRTPIRAMQELGHKVAIPTEPLTSFSNAIAISFVQALQHTPLGLFPGLFRGSPSVQTQIDEWESRFRATLTIPFGVLLSELILQGVVIGGWPPPEDPAEKAKMDQLGVGPLELAFPVGKNRYIILPMHSGPLVPLRAYNVVASAMNRVRYRARERLERAARISAERGATFNPEELANKGELFNEILIALAGLMTGGRTMAGKFGPAAAFIDMTSKLGAARWASTKIPFLPIINSFMREVKGVDYVPRLSSFWSLFANFLPGGKQRMNMFGEPVGTEQDVKSLLQRLTIRTGSMRDMRATPDGLAYYNTISVGYVPPVPDPNRLFIVGDTLRRMKPEEMASYMALRGQIYKNKITALGPLEPGPESERLMRRAHVEADTEALQALGFAPATLRQQGTGGGSGGARAIPLPSSGQRRSGLPTAGPTRVIPVGGGQTRSIPLPSATVPALGAGTPGLRPLALARAIMSRLKVPTGRAAAPTAIGAGTARAGGAAFAPAQPPPAYRPSPGGVRGGRVRGGRIRTRFSRARLRVRTGRIRRPRIRVGRIASRFRRPRIRV